MTSFVQTCTGTEAMKAEGRGLQVSRQSPADPCSSVLHDDATAPREGLGRKAPTVGHEFRCGLAGSETWDLGCSGWDIWRVVGLLRGWVYARNTNWVMGMLGRQEEEK